VVEEVDCGFSRDERYVFLRGLLATSLGTFIDLATAQPDLLSPYIADVLGLIGELGPEQAAAIEALVERWHRQVQERVFGKGYRVLLMPTMASPLVRADMFASHDEGLDVWESTGLGYALTWPWNVLNRYPVVDVPLGLADERMPTGMQVIGQSFTDLDTFAFASAWSRLAPPLFADGLFPTFT
jgi:amidase